MSFSKKLKIGVVVDQLLPGGVQLAAIEQVKELRKLGHQAKLLILMRKKYDRDYTYLVKEIPYQYLSDQYPAYLRKPIKFPIFTFFSTLHILSPILAPQIINKKDFDILVSHGTTTCLTTYSLWRRRKIPYLAVIHDPMVYILEKSYPNTSLQYLFPLLKPLAKYLEGAFVKQAQATIIDSQVHYRYLENSYQVKSYVLPLGCQTLGKLPTKRGPCLLAFGRWQTGKNPEFLLNLIKKFPKRKLIIAGSWTNQQDLEKLTKQIRKDKLEPQVQLITHYTQAELKKICRQSRFWLHAHFEAFGLAGLEAAGHGLPIIIPAKSGVSEIFQDGIHGFFPQKINTREYQQYAKKLLINERLAYRMGKAAYQIVKEKYSWQANTKKLLGLIEKSLGLKKPEMWIIEIARAKGTSLAGGDKLMEPIAIRIANKYKFNILTSRFGTKHWQKAPLRKKIYALPQNRFDQKGSPVPVFITYLIRMFQTYKILTQKATSGIIYSSNHLLPDILPAYFIKKKRPYLTWIARIHHLIPPPHQRVGRFYVNLVSYLMQLIALKMTKNQADIIITLNQKLREHLLKQGFPQTKLAVLGGGVEFQKISQYQPARQTEYEAVFLGRLHPSKGIFDTIPIWQELIKTLSQTKLAIIGQGPKEIKQELIKQIQKAKLEKNIKVLGFLPYKEVFQIMKNAKVFLFLDHEAGWGLAVAEAMACGLPVIGYHLGILDEVFQKGFVTVPAFNTKLMAQKISRLLSDISQRQKLAKVAFSQAKKLSWEKVTQRFISIISANQK